MEIMRTLEVQWTHKTGQTKSCYLCSDTGRDFLELLRDVTPILESDGIRVAVSEKATMGGEENRIFLNGRPLEELLDEAQQGQSYCHSTKWEYIDESRKEVAGPGGQVCQEAPELLFRKAILRALEPGSP
ncbi:MAG: DUF2703 domain-containing protein [Methanoregulaceae archaeon]|jgi:hypothetical protein|nr:DUF2703 domain-containing protein [Methanoregulaceae archaeon]MDD3090376.1 DUF2703 domain-containing protein [Methanoregulaceae archaeon]MDD5047790.1 DUF2703 domain-containing protein [Methanoregulaceae archaeon]HPJ73431.1 DUF2703 domain-containing protein [Methanoregulaceae archaeon]